jgi:OFA family oxalate/formate antiporter-like MFS transporter
MGAGYAFSVFKKELISMLKCTAPQATLAYSLSFAFLPIGMLLGGALSRKFGPRISVMAGGILFGMGVMLAGFAKNVCALYLTYGLMVSIGNGIVYATVIAVAVRWFPDRKGLASGSAVAALGVGAMIIAYVAQSLVTHVGVQGALRLMGMSFAIIMVLASLLLVEAPKGFALAFSAGSNRKKGGQPTTGPDVTWAQMLKQPAFWVLFVIYVCATAPGLMLISEAKEVVTNIAKLGDLAAASLVGLLGGIASAAGRLGWAAVSDKAGRLNVVTALLIISGAVMLVMPKAALSSQGLWFSYLLIGLCYGGALGTFPSLCADRFGSKNIEVNYALLFVAFSVASMTGPRFGALLKEASGGYTSGFMFAAALAGVGLVLSFALRLKKA